MGRSAYDPCVDDYQIPINAKPSYAACHTAQPYPSDPVSADLLRAGETLCIHTPGGRQGVVWLESASGNKLTLGITIYAKTGE